ncbi:MAG: hypothetical protein JJW00_02760 [Sulfurimonas sp.]|nr:hypothetical protein [Sulfurimonas sp.]
MFNRDKNITSLLEYVQIDRFYVSCHFRCKFTNKSAISTVALEPYHDKADISWQDALMHPIDSYNRYYHTPITIYNYDSGDTIVLKAFDKISKYFKWSPSKKSYIYKY